MNLEPDCAMSLDELLAKLQPLGDEYEILQREHFDGSSEAVLTLDGVPRASWRGRLAARSVPIDGVTPRGPKEYFGLRFYP